MGIRRGELAEVIVKINEDLKPYGLRYVDGFEVPDSEAVFILDNDYVRRCPFCGGPGKVELACETDGTYYVECMKCGAVASGSAAELPCSVEGAIEEWNSRVISCKVCPGPGGKRP